MLIPMDNRLKKVPYMYSDIRVDSKGVTHRLSDKARYMDKDEIEKYGALIHAYNPNVKFRPQYDMADYPFNAKFPPKNRRNGDLYHGYDTTAEECLFYDFAVQGYD